jgi:hypothetical protein
MFLTSLNDDKLSPAGREYILEYHAEDVAKLRKYVRLGKTMVAVQALLSITFIVLIARMIIAPHECQVGGQLIFQCCVCRLI